MRILITKTLLRCSAAFLDWTVAELDQMGRRTRKLMTMHWTLNPRSDIADILI